MTLDILLALAAFAFVSTISPGPNNLMLMASGLNFGFRESIPHMLGIVIGFTLMIALVGLGLARVFDIVPGSRMVLRIVSILYLLWLAWKIATAAPPEGSTTAGRPFTFLQAALFQWVNPKAWAIALTAIGAYAPGHTVASILAVALAFGTISLPCIGSWTLLGGRMRRILSNPARRRVFNRAMAILLVASLYPVFVG